jgi:hypothetical protein
MIVAWCVGVPLICAIASSQLRMISVRDRLATHAAGAGLCPPPGISQ